MVKKMKKIILILCLLLSVLGCKNEMTTNEGKAKVYYHYKTVEPYLALTFDDGPNKVQTIKTLDISKFNGNCFLGIDAGSTTTKAALIDDKGNLLYTHYSSNEGKPLKVVIDIMNEIYNILPPNSKIVSISLPSSFSSLSFLLSI